MHPLLWWGTPKLYFNDEEFYLTAMYLGSWEGLKKAMQKKVNDVWQLISASKYLTRHMIRIPWLHASNFWKRPAVNYEKKNSSWNGVWELKIAAVLGDSDLGALYLLKHLQNIIKEYGGRKKKGKKEERTTEREGKFIQKKVVRTFLGLGEHEVSSRMDCSDNETLESD